MWHDSSGLINLSVQINLKVGLEDLLLVIALRHSQILEAGVDPDIIYWCG
jgi:hypothetical protein